MQIFSYFANQTSFERALNATDLEGCQSYIIYWQRFESANPNVTKIVGNTKEGQALLSEHVRLNGRERCIYSSLQEAARQLASESKYPDTGGYILCSNTQCDSDTDIRHLIIKEAINGDQYFLYSRNALRIESVTAIVPGSSSKI
ncbi:MAG: hypothetical protein V4496_03345 [Pseudomonadota bacterium]